jgi:hypothetical protein
MSTVLIQSGDPVALDWLENLAASLIGFGRVWELQERLARGMLMEALRRTGANYTQAAHLLGVKRQAIQQMVLRFDLEDWAAVLRHENQRREPTPLGNGLCAQPEEYAMKIRIIKKPADTKGKHVASVGTY